MPRCDLCRRRPVDRGATTVKVSIPKGAKRSTSAVVLMALCAVCRETLIQALQGWVAVPGEATWPRLCALRQFYSRLGQCLKRHDKGLTQRTLFADKKGAAK